MDSDSDELTAELKAQVEEWSSNSNDCFTIALRRGDGSTAASFGPDFTYPIFNDEEAIFGYQDLAITLTFAAHNLRPHVDISYAKKFSAQVEGVAPTDIQAALHDFLPANAFSSLSLEEALRDEHAAHFTPPGERIHQYSRDGVQLEVWCASLHDATARQLLENMQVLVPMFIEGGTILQLEQDWTAQRWKIFLLYQYAPSSAADPAHSPYSLVGYATSYRVFTFPDRQKPLESDVDLFSPSGQSIMEFLPPPETAAIPNDFAPTAMPNNMTSPLDMPSRERLSQFLILPAFQASGHGQELYNTMYTYLTKLDNIREFTVEDPNEAFDDLRDLCDLLHLRTHVPEFAALRVNTTVPLDKLKGDTNVPTDLIVHIAAREKIMRETKIMQRQFDRLVEMHTLSFIPPLHRSRSRITRKEKSSNEHDRAYYFWRLYAKQRLYIFNRDELMQVEREERVEKLEAALDSVLEGYIKCIDKVEAREKEAADGLNGDAAAIEGASATPKIRPSKRKVVDDGEDDDDEEDGGDDGLKVAVNGHKKPRVE